MATCVSVPGTRFSLPKAQLDLWHIKHHACWFPRFFLVIVPLIHILIKRDEDSWYYFAFSILSLATIYCFALLYNFARVYLVVECFLSLAHLHTWYQRTFHRGSGWAGTEVVRWAVNRMGSSGPAAIPDVKEPSTAQNFRVQQQLLHSVAFCSYNS
jgi:hypothetical protein